MFFVTTDFCALNSNWGKQMELALRDSLAAGKEYVTGSKVALDRLQLKSGLLKNLDLTGLFFVLCCTFLMYN